MGTIATIDKLSRGYICGVTYGYVDRPGNFVWHSLMGSPENDRVNFNIDWIFNGAGMLDFNKRGHGIWRNNNVLNMDTTLKQLIRISFLIKLLIHRSLYRAKISS